MIARNRAIMAVAVLALGARMAYAQQDEGPILQPKPKPKPVAQSALLVTCDLACNWTLDGAAKGRIDAGASVKTKVSPGQHAVAAETEDALDKAENEIKVKAAGETIAHIWLQTVRDARLKAEQEARDKAAQEAKAKTAQEARDKAAQEARYEAALEAQARAEKEARDKAAQGARDKAFLEARDKASQKAQARAEQEARDKARKQAQAKAAQDARDNAARNEWDREQPERGRVAQLNNAGGAWTDPVTELMWTRKDNGYALRWQPAAEYCRSLQLGGYSDWRLPSIEELMTIYNPAARVACGTDGYKVCQIKGRIQLSSGVVWSSSRGEGPQFMRGFYFRGPGEPRRHVLELDKRGVSYDRALCVRSSGQ
jgi:hypothetical protein